MTIFNTSSNEMGRVFPGYTWRDDSDRADQDLIDESDYYLKVGLPYERNELSEPIGFSKSKSDYRLIVGKKNDSWGEQDAGSKYPSANPEAADIG